MATRDVSLQHVDSLATAPRLSCLGAWHVGSQLLDQGSNLRPLQKGFLTMGAWGRSLHPLLTIPIT